MAIVIAGRSTFVKTQMQLGELHFPLFHYSAIVIQLHSLFPLFTKRPAKIDYDEIPVSR